MYRPYDELATELWAAFTGRAVQLKADKLGSLQRSNA